MNPIDIIIIIIIGYCFIRGVFRGLIKEMSSIIGVFAGYYAAYTYYIEFAKFLSKHIFKTQYLNAISFMILFCGIFLAISLLGILIKKFLKIPFLGLIDRICGAGFGFIKGIIIVSIVLIIITIFLPDNKSIKESLLSPQVSMISEKMIKVVPKDLKQEFDSKIKKIKKHWL